jgi:hypothetical protein
MTTDEKEPDFRPRMGRRNPPRSGGSLRSFRNALMHAYRGAGRLAGRSRIAVQMPARDARRVAVKVHVVRQRPGTAKVAAMHLDYIQRDGVERDGSPGMLYDDRGPASADAFEQSMDGECHQFRMIISPEDGARLELTDFVRRFMARVEGDLERKLQWAAVPLQH